ncbi:MAG: penicillin-binding protein 2 [Parcubacteria group bacterium]|jgi:cell division protein FtsI/penicillin-binding protein 2
MIKNNLSRKKADSNLSIKNWRIYTLVFFVVAIALIIISRLYFLQIFSGESYRAIAENQHKILQILMPKRGEIYLKEGNDGLYPLAINRDLQLAYAVPKEIENKDEIIKKISPILGLDESFISGKLSNLESMFQVLKHKLSDDEVSRIKELNLSGIHFSPEPTRFYPSGELASQLVGFVGSDGDQDVGRYGLEASFEDILKGREGKLDQERDTGGRWISIADRNIEPAKNGDSLVLTIDHTVQYEVEKIIKEAVERHGADNGSAIVMEPATGKILAMANYPNFNPNDYRNIEDMSLFMNLNVNLPYECGSVFKTITEAIGIDNGKINPDSTYTDTGVVNEAGYNIKNSDGKSYGTQTMTQVLEKSLNTGAIHIEQVVGNKTYADYIERFGFGEKTGIDLPAESSGNISNLNNLRSNIQFFTASFGQGITVTPIQLINAYASIANKGMLMKPQIVDKVIHSDGSFEEVQPVEIRKVISESSARQVSQMLRSVVTNGHGKRADVPGYLVGGKTGTAQVASTTSKGYEEGITIGSFAGYAPVDDPQFAVLVKIYHPKDVEWAESSAAPTFGSIMKFLLEYYKVEPTEPYDINKLNVNSAVITPAVVPVVESASDNKKKK